MHLIYEALKKSGGKADGESLIAAAKCPFRNFLIRVNQLDFKGGGLIRGGVVDVDA